eukprot:359154-Chlamydomonas_euryale.AAC.9
MPTSGTASDTALGTNSAAIVGSGVSWPSTHSIVVVTSPMGLQQPPAFAAITTTAPRYRRVSGSGHARDRRLTCGGMRCDVRVGWGGGCSSVDRSRG